MHNEEEKINQYWSWSYWNESEVAMSIRSVLGISTQQGLQQKATN
jgi:hypothetical protein